MLQTRVIPCLLLLNDGLVKTIKFKNPKYVGDPINAIKIFNEKEVDELVFLDISATNENRIPRYDFITKIASECFMPLSYGGGIKSIDQIKTILNLGVEKVIINSQAILNPNFIRQAAENFGSSTIVVSIDYKTNLLGKNYVYICSGKKATNIEPLKHALQMQEMGAGEVILNSIDRDGTMKGYDLNIMKTITEKLDIPLVALGGAGSVNHFSEAIQQAGASAVAAGSFFVFHGPHRAVLITYPQVNELEKALNKS